MRPFADDFSTILQAYRLYRCLDKKIIKFPSLPRLIRLVCMSNLLTDKRFPAFLAGGTHLLQVLIGQREFLLVI